MDISGKILRGKVNGKEMYCRVPVARKIMGTGEKDTKILIDCGVSADLADLSYNKKTGVYSLDCSLQYEEDYMPSFSTITLLYLLPGIFSVNGHKYGIMFFSGPENNFGRRDLNGLIIDTDNEQEVEKFTGHPISVLVRLIEYVKTKQD